MPISLCLLSIAIELKIGHTFNSYLYSTLKNVIFNQITFGFPFLIIHCSYSKCLIHLLIT